MRRPNCLVRGGAKSTQKRRPFTPDNTVVVHGFSKEKLNKLHDQSWSFLCAQHEVLDMTETNLQDYASDFLGVGGPGDEYWPLNDCKSWQFEFSFDTAVDYLKDYFIKKQRELLDASEEVKDDSIIVKQQEEMTTDTANRVDDRSINESPDQHSSSEIPASPFISKTRSPLASPGSSPTVCGSLSQSHSFSTPIASQTQDAMSSEGNIRNLNQFITRSPQFSPAVQPTELDKVSPSPPISARTRRRQMDVGADDDTPRKRKRVAKVTPASDERAMKGPSRPRPTTISSSPELRSHRRIDQTNLLPVLGLDPISLRLDRESNATRPASTECPSSTQNTIHVPGMGLTFNTEQIARVPDAVLGYIDQCHQESLRTLVEARDDAEKSQQRYSAEIYHNLRSQLERQIRDLSKTDD